MEPQKRVYETTFILNATLDDAQIDLVIEKFKDFVTKQGGEIRTLDKWGRKRLTYSIQKKNNGFYVACELVGPPDTVQKLERYYSLDENIMRFLTVYLSEKTLKARQEQAKRSERLEAAGTTGGAAVISGERSVVTPPPPPPSPPPEPKPAVKAAPPVVDEDDVT